MISKPSIPALETPLWRRVPARRGARWLGIYVGVWTLISLYLVSADLWFMRSTIGPAFTLARLGMFLTRGYGWALVSLLTLAILHFAPLHRNATPVRWLIHGISSVIITLLGLALAALEVPWFYQTGNSFFQQWWILVMRDFHFSYLIYYWGLVAIHEGIQLLRLIQAREELARQLQTKLLQAQLRAIKIQLSPHFLFNALNTVAALLRSDPNTAGRTLIQLSELLRKSLSTAYEPEALLNQELAFIEGYLDIEKLRFGGRLNFDLQADARVRDALVPSFILHPLIENAIRHAVSPRASGANIILRVRQESSRLIIEIEDDGPGFATLDPGSTPVFHQTQQRLEQLYDTSQGILALVPSGGGTLIRLILPFVSSRPSGSAQEPES
jgi:sensor histidine kinase YesM